jgi:hypothetical protein
MRNTSVITLTALLFTAATALAGRKDGWPVTIDLVNKRAYGSLGSARNSPDSYQMIGCSVHYDPVNGKNNVNCSAQDAAKNTAQCASQQPELVQIALGIGSDSFVQFSWDAAGECTGLHVGNDSSLAPKAP